MSESKLLEQDKDEWIYHSMNKYSNLYMFELEYPLDSLEIINETSLCISGVQEYSKKCELLQLCVPPKLLRSEDEEGLCKDRDFKILSGGYTEGRVRETKFLRQSSNLIATTQEGFNGIVVYEVGDDTRATILEKQRLLVETDGLPSALYCMKDRILMSSKQESTTPTGTEGAAAKGITLYEWKIDQGLGTTAKSHSIWTTNPSNLKLGYIEKMKEWDEHTSIFLTTHGTIALYDLRTNSETPGIFFHATKSPNLSSGGLPVIFSFDSIPQLNKIGVIDSCGGYEIFDPRYTGSKTSTSSSSLSNIVTTRSLLPDFGNLAGVYPNWFNIEYEPQGTKVREEESRCSSCRFIISGVKKECVPVYEEVVDVSALPHDDVTQKTKKFHNESGEEQQQHVYHLASVFSHDGHSKPVTHSMWHPSSQNLIFSASLDAVLHAWQFVPQNLDN